MVSIITPVYNSENVLRECVESVLSQSFQDWELILVDDSSTDNSKEIILEYASFDSRIKYLFLDENSGAGIARNKGIQIAKYRFIAFLDSDDYWHKNKLELQIQFMLENNVAFSYTRYYHLDQNDRPTRLILSPKSVNFRKLMFNNYIKTLTVIYDSMVTGKVYMPEYRKRQDWGLWFNILEKTKTAECLTVPLAYYRTSNASLSKKKLKLIKENFNFYRFFLKKSVLLSVFMMFIFLIVHLLFRTFGYTSVNMAADKSVK